MPVHRIFSIATLALMAVLVLALLVLSPFFPLRSSAQPRLVGVRGKIEAIKSADSAEVIIEGQGVGLIKRIEVNVHKEDKLKKGDSVVLVQEPTGLVAVPLASN